MYSDTDFTPAERAMLSELEKGDQQGATETSGELDAGADQSQAAAQQDAQAGNASDSQQTTQDQAQTSDAATSGEAQATDAQGKKPGDLRNALRASRRAERAARESEQSAVQEAERLRQQIADLQAGKTIDQSSPDLTERELAEMEADFPAQAAVIRKLNAKVQQLTESSAQSQKQATQAQEFIPAPLVPALQEAVDDIPDLLDMQNDPDQTRWALAVKADGLLLESPRWANKPLAERLAEAARIANEQVSPPAATRSSQQNQSSGEQSQIEKARQRIEQAATTTPTSISDIRGGASPNSKSGPDYARMSDDEIMSSLG